MRRMAWLALLGLLAAAPAVAGGTKTASGKLRTVRDNVLVIEKKGFVRSGDIEIEMDNATKKTGQVVPGMHVKVKYREEDQAGHVRRIATEVEAWPEFASKTAREAAKQTRP